MGPIHIWRHDCSRPAFDREDGLIEKRGHTVLIPEEYTSSLAWSLLSGRMPRRTFPRIPSPEGLSSPLFGNITLRLPALGLDPG